MIKTQTLALLAMTSFGAVASDARYSNDYVACMDQSAGITAHVTECIGAETARQDRFLNAIYKQLIGRVDQDQTDLLRSAQRAWLSFRDDNCGLYYQWTGGTMDNINGASCVLEMTATRAVEIKGLLDM